MKKGWYIYQILSLFLLVASITKATEVKINHLQLPSLSSGNSITDDTIKKANPSIPTISNEKPLMTVAGCDLDSIRKALTDAGNIELLGLQNGCSLYFINPDSMSGPDAQAYAQTFGANLISIQSAQENSDLQAALVNQGFGGKVIWIGFNDQKVEGTFEWFDGSDITYTNWNSGEPNNSGDEDCTQIYADGYWNDLNCSGYNSLSVIEVNLCPVTTIAPVKPTKICLGEKITLETKTILGAPTYKYSWTSNPPGFTSNVQSPEVSPAGNTTYSVDVTDRYGCKSSSTVLVTVDTLLATISPSGPITICDGDSVVLTAGAGVAYLWSTTDTTQSITVKKAGTYIVGVSVPPCIKMATVIVNVNPSPVAKFKNNTACLGTGTQFNDLSTNATFWDWDFGDGAKGVGQNPNHTYAKAGIYKVNLAVSGPGNCKDTIQQLVTVNDTPVVSFFNFNTCTKDSIYFVNTTTVDSLSTITSYLYDFGDGKTGALPKMAHLYTVGGNYKVKLTVTTSEGCSASTINNTPVFDSPVAAVAGIQNYCASDSAQFINNSTIGGTGKITKLYWIFGDGAVDSVTKHPKHLYAPGTYTVKFILVSDKGCIDSIQKDIEIYPAVVANYTALDVCLHEPTNFTNLSTGPVSTYEWDFDDGSTESLRDPSHIYTQAKIYSVKLKVTSLDNCTSTIVKKVAVHELPTAKFIAPNVCEGKNVVFTDKSIISGNSSVTQWAWEFDDGTALDSTQSPQHLYADVKQYNIKLKVSSNYGCSDSTTKIVTINPNPVTDFTATDTAACSPFTTTFQNQSTISSGKIIKWLWEFGSINSKSDLKDPPPHEFKNTSNTTPVKFTIKLTATSDSGCVVTMSKPSYITVLPTPNAAFTVDPPSTLVTDPVISFTNMSVGGDSCKWGFADIGTSDLCNPPPFSFVDTGSYVVSLISSNLSGCADTAYRTVVIEPDYVLYIPNSFTPNADDVNDTFGAKGSFIKDYEMTIYDRWGDVVYQTNDINLPWNGGYKGVISKPVPETVYVYSMKIKATNKKSYAYRGMVMLIR